jgi:hypothetical protein
LALGDRRVSVELQLELELELELIDDEDEAVIEPSAVSLRN